MEGGVDHARRYSICDLGAQRRFTRPASHLDPISIVHAPILCIMRMNFEQIF